MRVFLNNKNDKNNNDKKENWLKKLIKLLIIND